MCGILGIFGSNEAANLVALGLFAEQHRGQESCGMAVTDGQTFRLRKKMGLVKEVFRPEKLAELKGNIAIGHVRYPTCGSSSESNSQPHTTDVFAGPTYALASNGDIVNYNSRKLELIHKGVSFNSSNDGELILKNIVYEILKNKHTIIDAIKETMKTLRGAFSTVFASHEEMYLFRDPHGFRPMTWGELENGEIAVASESCALDILNPKWVKEVKPAQIIKVTKKGYEIIDNDPKEFGVLNGADHCIFEHIYFSRPDSYDFGESVYEVREKIGAKLAELDDIEPDVCVPVPDSANFIALGYAKKKGVPFEMGLIRNHYVGRTFIKPEQTIRDESVRQKFNPLYSLFKDKKVVLVDDSIVRGTTIRKIVKMVKNAGAKEVHLRIGSPQVKFSCFYGIDTPTKEELIANNKSLSEIIEWVGADSIKHIPLDKLKEAVNSPQDYCYACFDGNYPELEK